MKIKEIGRGGVPGNLLGSANVNSIRFGISACDHVSGVECKSDPHCEILALPPDTRAFRSTRPLR